MVKKKLPHHVRDVIRVKHNHYETEKSYINWINRYILYHHKRHPLEMGEQASLLYGVSLRFIECLRLRIKEMDFKDNQIMMRIGKDRVTMLPAISTDLLKRHI